MKRVLAPALIFSLVSAELKDNLDYLFETKFPISDYVWNTKNKSTLANKGKGENQHNGANQTKGKKVLTDKNGKPIIYDEKGRIKGSSDSVLFDQFGNPVLDKDGNPININDKNKLARFLEDKTQNSLAKQLRKEQERLQRELEAQRNALLAQEEARRKAEEEARKRAEEKALHRAREAQRSGLSSSPRTKRKTTL